MRTVEMWVRSILFNLFYLFWLIVPTVLFVWVLLLGQKIVFKCIWFWQSAMAAGEKYILGLDYIIEGEENIPEGPCLIASKHQSAWETCKLNILFENPSIVLKKELTYVPIWGWYAKASGLIPIDRKAGIRALSQMMKAAKKAREQGRKIVIFPQGTRVPPGVKKPYKVGVAVLYKELGLPVVPMSLNAGHFWQKGSFFKKQGTVTIRFSKPIPPGLGRKEFLSQLEKEIETQSDALVKEVSSS